MADDQEYTAEQEQHITFTMKGLYASLQKNKIPVWASGPALMVMSAQIAILSDHTDEYIIEQYRLCLLDARTRSAQKEGRGN